METNGTVQEQEPIKANEVTKPIQSGNVFSQHKVWWLVLLVVCLVFSVALPSRHARPDLIWAEVLGRAVGMLLGGFLLAGIVWLASLVVKSRMTSAQFMACLTVAVACLVTAQVFLLVYRANPAGESVSGHKPPHMNSAVALYRQAYPDDARSDDAITIELAQTEPHFATYPDAVADYARITGQHPDPNSASQSAHRANEPVRLWRQQHPDDSRSDDQITVHLAHQNPEAFNTYEDAISDFRRIVTNELALFWQGARAYEPDNPLHVWVLNLVNEQDRAVQARGVWDPSALLRDGRTFLPREDCIRLMTTNPAAASNYWTLSNREMLQRVWGVRSVPRQPGVVTNLVEVPADLTASQVEAIAFGQKVISAPYASADHVLYNLGPVSLKATVEQSVSGVVSDSSVLNRFELTLRKYGIPIDEDARAGVIVSASGVWVRPDNVVLAYECRSDIYDTAILNRSNDFRKTAVTVWTEDRGGVVSRSLAGRAILEETERLAEEFARVYLKSQK